MIDIDMTLIKHIVAIAAVTANVHICLVEVLCAFCGETTVKLKKVCHVVQKSNGLI